MKNQTFVLLIDIQLEMTFKGNDDVDARQRVYSSPTDNLVEYHVTKNGEQLWVVDDFITVFNSVPSPT